MNVSGLDYITLGLTVITAFFILLYMYLYIRKYVERRE